MSVAIDTSEMNVLFVHSSLDDYPLTPEEFRVYAHLARRAKDGKAYPGVTSIGRVCRIHPDTARAVVRRLAEYGLIRIEVRGHLGLPNMYHLTPRSAWKSVDEVLAAQEASANATRSKKKSKQTPSTQTTPPEMKGGDSNTPPVSREGGETEGGGGGETKGGEGGCLKGAEGNPARFSIQGHPEQTTATAGEGELEAGKDNPGGLPSGKNLEQEFTQQGGADRADAPHGADGVNAQIVSETAQGAATAENAQPTSLEKVPPGAALAALTAALAGMKKPVADLIAEYPDRQGWLELAPSRIRELLAAARTANGKHYRGALIDALDAEVRRLSTPPAPLPYPQPQDDDIDMAALIDGAPLDGNRRRA